MSTPQLNAVERLQAAAIAAPRLRGMRCNPRITTLDAEGNPVRQVSASDLAKAHLIRQGIEFDTPEAPWCTCEGCGQMFERATTKTGLKRTLCDVCKVSRCACGKQLNKYASCPSRMQRSGGPPQCRACAGTVPKPRAYCLSCGGTLSGKTMSPSHVARRNGGPAVCHPCANARRRAAVTSCGCGKLLPKQVTYPSMVKKRDGAPPRCLQCANRRDP